MTTTHTAPAATLAAVIKARDEYRAACKRWDHAPTDENARAMDAALDAHSDAVEAHDAANNIRHRDRRLTASIIEHARQGTTPADRAYIVFWSDARTAGVPYAWDVAETAAEASAMARAAEPGTTALIAHTGQPLAMFIVSEWFGSDAIELTDPVRGAWLRLSDRRPA